MTTYGQKRLPDLEAWAIFAAVAARRSFAGAAADLGLSDPTVSKAVTRLERRLGVSLLSRTSRQLSLTEAGRAALGRAARLLADGEALEDEATENGQAPRGPIRMAAPLSFGIAHLAGVLPAFGRTYPGIVLDLALSDRRVDLVAESFDLALRIGVPEDSTLLCRYLCTVRLLLVAAPGHTGAIERPRDLAGHRALGYSGGGGGRDAWRFRHPELGEEVAAPDWSLWSDNADTLLPTLLAGWGVALLPDFLIWRLLRDRRLERLLPDWSAPPLALHLLMPPSPLRPYRVRLLVEHLLRTLATPPWADGTEIAER